MKAVRFHEHGGPEVLRYEDAPAPEVGPNDVLVRVKAVGVNRLDIWARNGTLPVKVPLPHISGSEVAGEVARIGQAVNGLSEGQSVAIAPYLSCGACEFCLQGEETICIRSDILGLISNGGYAEYVAVPATHVMPLPDGVGVEQAAAIGLAAITAWHMLVDKAKVKPGETVLIHGASSGVGSAGIQIAKLMGAKVITTAGSDAKLETARQYGADEVINYQQADFFQEVRKLTNKRGVDVVFEHIGQDTWEKSVASLARNGRLVTCGATTGNESKLHIWAFFAKQLQIIGSYGGTRDNLRRLLDVTARGQFRPVVDRSYPLRDLNEALARLESRKQFGKILVCP